MTWMADIQRPLKGIYISNDKIFLFWYVRRIYASFQTGLCLWQGPVFCPESHIPCTDIRKRMTVSGTPLSPSFGSQEGQGERSDNCGAPTPRNVEHSSHFRLWRHWHHAYPNATASRSAAVTYADFGWSAHAVIASARKVPRSLCFMLPATLRYVRHLHAPGQDNAVYTVTMVIYFLCPCTRQG